MDIITDLSSEAVSYITVIQDLWRSKKVEEEIEDDENVSITLLNALNEIKVEDTVVGQFQKRINEIIWSGNRKADDEFTRRLFFETAGELLGWLKNRFDQPKNERYVIGNEIGLDFTPEHWRNQIKTKLYNVSESRIALAEALNYMPVQVIYALAGKVPQKYEQRLYQCYYKSGTGSIQHLLSAKEAENLNKFWNFGTDSTEDRKIAAAEYLKDQSKLLEKLNKDEITVPFLSLFEEELKEIENARKYRKREFDTAETEKFPIELGDAKDDNDPENKADKMLLAGIAFSGGGIRSATFNLGILQKLAEIGALPRFDYISTVSGGGYIGSWYTSWIHRKKSVKKVTDRLDCTKSTNPLAEEVRPIRWLRMFSNYLSPNSSIMSTDAWTVGMIWLRNTIINQVVLLSILVTILALINLSYQVWLKVTINLTDSQFLSVISVLIGIGVYFAAKGMRAYSSNPDAKTSKLFDRKNLPYSLMLWAILSGVFLSIAFLHKTYLSNYWDKLNSLHEIALPCLGGMLLIAFIGGYYSRKKKHKESEAHDWWQLIAIIGSSILASGAFVAVLAGSWEAIVHLECLDKMMVFIFGIPIIIEAFCITVVVRMLIMGSYFPDERREWWGRMGAMLHRFIFWWMLITFAALRFPDIFQLLIDQYIAEFLPVVGGWTALVTAAVRMAYTSTTSGEKQESGMGKAKDIFVRIAPYLFMAGFLLIGAAVLRYLIGMAHLSSNAILNLVLLLLILAGTTALLSLRAGVNEFSLHDFYKNRLVRAYLGAPRRRTDREQTANSFTGFDKDDDIPLKNMKKDYPGPYPLINTTLNATTVTDLDRQDRMAESFVFSPLYCGFDINPTRSSSLMDDNIFNFGYRPTKEYSGESGPSLGTAMAVSGAAVSPNMGYHSSAATSFLLTIFNVRLGLWMGNPRKKYWRNADPIWGLGYLLSDLIGKSDVNANYVYLSDGGHFDNMGLYELVRRRCSYILLGDGEQDENAICEGLANAIRRCRIDFGVEIDLDVTKITEKNAKTQLSDAHLVAGTIKYPNRKEPGTIIYVKASITNINQADIREYHLRNPKFPQESTGDQFFDEAQFESYRKLGYNSIENIGEILYGVWKKK